MERKRDQRDVEKEPHAVQDAVRLQLKPNSVFAAETIAAQQRGKWEYKHRVEFRVNLGSPPLQSFRRKCMFLNNHQGMSSSWLSLLPCYDILAARWSPRSALQDSAPAPSIVDPPPAATSESLQLLRPPSPVIPASGAPSAAELSWAEGARKVQKAAKPWQYPVADEDDDEVAEFVAVRLRGQADPWPDDAQTAAAPETDAEVLDPSGLWSPDSCGVEIRACSDDADKGLGAFATRPMAQGRVVGVYWGERLTQREHAVRHGWRSGTTIADLTPADRKALAERRARLAALTFGAPIHGADNGSSYCFSILADELLAALGSTMLPRRTAYIDGEDPTRSSWCRYINHCAETRPGCNLEPKCDGIRCLVWFEARREIAAGEELCFDYSEHYRWDTPGSGMPERDR